MVEQTFFVYYYYLCTSEINRSFVVFVSCSINCACARCDIRGYFLCGMASSGVPLLSHRLAAVKDRTQIDALLRDRQYDGITAQGRLLLYINPKDGVESHMNGLLPVLAQVFWPDDDVESRTTALNKAKRQAVRDASAIRHAAAQSGVFYMSSASRRGKHGKRAAQAKQKSHGLSGVARGTLVHRQIEDALLIDPASFRNKYGSCDTRTQAFFDFVEH